VWFREAHGEEMEQLFLSRLAKVRGVSGALALWMRVVRDALATSAHLRSSTRAPGRGRAMRQARMTTSLWQDARCAARQLIRTPVFTASAVALLAVGLGANVAVFTVADHLVIRGPGYERPEEVVYLYEDSDSGTPSSCSFPTYRDMAASSAFIAVAATSPAVVTWERGDGDVEATVEFTTARYLDVAGLQPQRGRWFSREHDLVGSEPVAVVSAAAWRSRFGQDPDVVGRTIRLNGQAVTIIGVGPDGVSGSFDPVITDFWLSISAVFVDTPYRVTNLERRADHWYDVLARLAPGVTPEAAQSAMNGLAARLADAYPESNRGRDITVRRATDVRLYEDEAGVLLAAGALALTLLVLACANLGNVLLVRGIGRAGEMAVRRALGAGSGRVAQLFLVESLVLSAAGGVLGLALARALLLALPSMPLPAPFSRVMDLTIDVRVGAFAIALIIVTGVLFGLAPALRSARRDIASVLRDAGRTASLGRGTLRLRNALVVVQVAGSLVLIVTAGLLGRSVLAMTSVDPGVDADRVAYVRTSFSAAGASGPGAAMLLEQLRQRVASLPGVSRAAAASFLPAQLRGTTTTVVEGYTPASGAEAVELHTMAVTPQYFETVGLSILEGRGFTGADRLGADRVILVNQAAARLFWGGVDPVGRRLRPEGRPDVIRTVVGVVEDAPVIAFPERPTRPMFYVPEAQAALAAPYLLARTDGDAASLAHAMRTAVTGVRSTLPVLSQGTVEAHFGAALAQPRFLARVVGAVSVLAMVLAALGIYAVVAFNVARRASELGIRVALGANPGRVARGVAGETAGAVALGLAGGLVVAGLTVRRLQSVLFGIEPLDPIAFAGAVAVLMLVSWFAALLPARRAAHANPARTLRSA
jgi:predicted permease